MKTLPNFIQVDKTTMVCTTVSTAQSQLILDSDITHIVSFIPTSAQTFDEKAIFSTKTYSHIPIINKDDLKQLTIMNFDKALRMYHGQMTLLMATNINFIGAAVALRAGWLRGRKMDTAIERGKAHGLAMDNDDGFDWENETKMRLLVPR